MTGVVPEEAHPVSFLDDVVHQRARLGILSVLEEAEQADFTYLRKTLKLTGGNFGRHLEVLVGAGYVQLHKSYNGRRTRTWANITPGGRQAFLAEITALRALVAGVEKRGRLWPEVTTARDAA